MQYFSENNLFRIDAHEDGHYGLLVGNSGIFIKDNVQMFELFSLMCLVITEHVIPDNFEWLVTEQQEDSLNIQEDDVPF